MNGNDSVEQNERTVNGPRVRIIGLGGAGTNIVSGLPSALRRGASIGVLNTDIQAVNASSIEDKLIVGGSVTHGLGCGGEVSIGYQALDNDRSRVEAFVGNANLVILVAGLGGGTGSAATPMLAEIASKAGALVIVFATLPFTFEGPRRQETSQDAAGDIRPSAHGMILLPNDVLLQEGHSNEGVLQTFKVADRWIARGIQTLCSIVSKTGVINLDSGSLRTIFKACGGKTLFGTGVGRGSDYLNDAISDLLLCPLLHLSERTDAMDRLLINITASSDTNITQINEVVAELTTRFGDDKDILFGAVIEEDSVQSLEICILGKLEADGARVAFGDPNAQNSRQNTQSGLAIDSEIARDKKNPIAVHRSKLLGRRKPTKVDQDEFVFAKSSVDRGYFEKTDSNMYKGEDLDVPTFFRKGIVIRLK